MKWLVGGAMWVLVAAVPVRAHCQPRRVSSPPREWDESPLPAGWFLPVGVNVGGVSHFRGGAGWVAGTEASLVHFSAKSFLWGGVYADALYDTAIRRARASTGLELGYLFFGLDGGPVLELGKAPAHFGLQIRPVLSVAYVQIYARWGAIFGKAQDDNFREIGLLLKYPFHVVDTRVRARRALR